MNAISHQIELVDAVRVAVDHKGTTPANGEASMIGGKVQAFGIGVDFDGRTRFSTGHQYLIEIQV